MADIVVYGGSFAATAAAAKAAACAPNKSVVVIIPDPEAAFGSIGTIGGQNFFDTRKKACTQGSFSTWLAYQGQFYGVSKMATDLKNYVTKGRTNVTVHYGYDITSFSRSSNPYRITQVTIKSISRDPSSGWVVWGSDTKTVTGTVFIDASDDGRLARIANSACTVGRYDWPADLLGPEEKGSTGKARQQAATLMFKVRDVFPTSKDGMSVLTDNGVTGCWGGNKTYKEDPTVTKFNCTYGPQGYAIKPLNAAQDGANSSEWWVNALLVFNVDGRAHERDRGTSIFPTDMRSDYKTVDVAWADAKKFIKTNSKFLEALRKFPGFDKAELVKDPVTDEPVVGSVLYLRETIHMSRISGNRGNGTENTNYALTAVACNSAGSASVSGKDQNNYKTRIGLNYYWTDINAYQFNDMMPLPGKFLWGAEIGAELRPDMEIDADSPRYPVYVPYTALTTNYVANLLIPGYAASICSFGWEESRVIPNLCVLGDAAGVAAAYAVNNGKQPGQLVDTDVEAIQKTLRSYGACLEKPNV